MILYTQYCPMSVFFVSAHCWFHSVPEMVLFVTIAIANVFILLGNAIACTVFSYEFLVFCTNLLLSLSLSKWFSPSFRWFQFVPGSYSWFQVVPTHFRLFLTLVCALQDMCAAFLLLL